MMVFIVLLGLAGCKQDIPKVILMVDGVKTTNPGVHTMVRKGKTMGKGTVMTWHANSQFWVAFDPKNNPCELSTAAAGSNVYPAAKQASGAYEATCTMAKQPVGAAPFEYNINSGAPPTTPTLLISGHCEGCIIDE